MHLFAVLYPEPQGWGWGQAEMSKTRACPLTHSCYSWINHCHILSLNASSQQTCDIFRTHFADRKTQPQSGIFKPEVQPYLSCLSAQSFPHITLCFRRRQQWLKSRFHIVRLWLADPKLGCLSKICNNSVYTKLVL